MTGAAAVALTTAAAGAETATATAATKYWYNTWKHAPTYPRLGDDRIGWLFPGNNYFYCEWYDK
ncbi:MAG TPA: hypothetical protein VG674_27675 [Amycolatopsis sp.]|nr:hypothetical protein [Amycolatopsis sp.]